MYRLLTSFLLCSLLLALSACATKSTVSPAPSSFQQGQLFTHQGTPATWAHFLEAASRADYILLGESHNNAFHHIMQARILAALTENGMQPVLGLEMLSTDMQPILNRYNQGNIALDDFPKALNWAKVWGFDYKLYEPVIRTAAEKHIPVHALNIPANTLRAVQEKGLYGIQGADQRFLPLRIIAPSAEQTVMLKAIYSQHLSMRKENAHEQTSTGIEKSARLPAPPMHMAGLPRFLLTQSLWDSTMAESAVRLRAKYSRPVVILAGSGHVEYGYGIYLRLQQLDPQASCLLVLPTAHPDRRPEALSSISSETTREAGGSAKVLPFAAHYYFYAAQRTTIRLGLELEFSGAAVKVAGITPGSPAAQAGVQQGDVILAMNGVEVKNAMDLHRAAGKSRAPKSVYTLTLSRNGTCFNSTLERLPIQGVSTTQKE